MSLTLYRGAWPQNVSKLAKYAVRLVGRGWQVTVQHEVEDGVRFLAVHGGGGDVAAKVNRVKQAAGEGAGGAFYVNEYRHIVVPVKHRTAGVVYYAAGRLEDDFVFEFEGQSLTTKPVDPSGRPLAQGDRWVGPRPGVPYVLAAGSKDIYHERPALTADDPPSVREGTTQKFKLSKAIGANAGLGLALMPIAQVRGHLGGRFYVNEHRAIFAPVDAGDGNGLDYIYCGQLDLNVWFPEPPLP
jgi:hypothetical protein